MPGEDREILEVGPILGELAFPISETSFSHEHQIKPVSKSQDACALIKVSARKGIAVMLVGKCFLGI
jgi:hypothetical protein